jgi:hypothetical protein
VEALRLTDGRGELHVVELPAGRYLMLEQQVDPGGEGAFRRNARATLFHDYRTTGRLAEGYVQRVRTLTADVEGPRTFRALLPLGEVRVDTAMLDSRVVELPAARAGRFLIRCEDDELPAAAREAMDELRARGHEPTGEVRDVVLHDFWPGDGVLWEVSVILGH